MAEFFNFLTTALETSVDKLFIVAGLVFLGVAIVGGTSEQIRPGKVGRIVGGICGPGLIVLGLGMSIVKWSSVQEPPPIAPPVLAERLPTKAPPPMTATPVHMPASTPTPRPLQLATHVAPPVQPPDDEMSGLLQTEIDYNRNAKQIIDSLGR